MYYAISIRQPWAALIVLGFKNIENRTWALPQRYRELWVGIHAGQQPDKAALEYPRQSIEEAAMYLATTSGVDVLDFTRRAKVHPEAFELGGVVGRAIFHDCILNGSNSVWANHSPKTWHWHISKAQPLPFVPCKGRLSFFDPTATPEVSKSKKTRIQQASLF